MLQLWAKNIAQISNDEALIFVMFNNDARYKGALYSALLRHPQELMAQYTTERKVRAYCHLIKRANKQRNEKQLLVLASRLNQVLEHYALSLLAITNQSTTQLSLN